jgi:hypothetical protein
VDGGSKLWRGPLSGAKGQRAKGENGSISDYRLSLTMIRVRLWRHENWISPTTVPNCAVTVTAHATLGLDIPQKR